METMSNIEKISCLIIDDDNWIHRIIIRYLNLWGFSVTSAFDPYEAVAMALKDNPTIIFLDIFLPDISGKHLLKLFRKLETTSNTPIIIMSGNLDKELLHSTYVNGANGFISKPITPNILAKKIQDCLDPDLFETILANSPELSQALIEQVG